MMIRLTKATAKTTPRMTATTATTVTTVRVTTKMRLTPAVTTKVATMNDAMKNSVKDSRYRLAATAALLLSILGLTGCAAGMGGDFSCSKVGGVDGCASMADIRANMDNYGTQQGGQGEASNSGNNGNGNNSGNANNSGLPLRPEFMAIPRRNREGHPVRSNDEVAKVTVFPFIDTEGHFVDTTDIYLILEDSRWIGRLPHAIKQD
jgi:conjugal transfer pilus assembly protein TraV